MRKKCERCGQKKYNTIEGCCMICAALIIKKAKSNLKDHKPTETDMIIYDAGFKNGEHQLDKTIVLLKKTNRQLYDELIRLDKISPVSGIAVNYKLMHSIINALKKPISRHDLAEKLVLMVKNARAKEAENVIEALSGSLSQ